MTLTTYYIEEDTGEQRPVEVTFNYYKGHRGYRDEYGRPETSDEPADVEILTIIPPIPGDKFFGEDIEWRLSKEEIDRIRGLCFKKAETKDDK